jgi:hypothetical protein
MPNFGFKICDELLKNGIIQLSIIPAQGLYLSIHIKRGHFMIESITNAHASDKTGNHFLFQAYHSQPLKQ